VSESLDQPALTAAGPDGKIPWRRLPSDFAPERRRGRGTLDSRVEDREQGAGFRHVLLVAALRGYLLRAASKCDLWRAGIKLPYADTCLEWPCTGWPRTELKSALVTGLA